MNEIYRQWVRDHQQQVWSLARQLLGEGTEAEDVSQEAFLRLWRDRKTVDTDYLRPWLLRVTRNLCLDRLRQRKPQADLDLTEQFHDQGPLAMMSLEEQQHWLRAAINQLDEPGRSLVVLRDMQQNSYEAIAIAMDMNLNQVKVGLHRARQRLRRGWEERQGE